MAARLTSKALAIIAPRGWLMIDWLGSTACLPPAAPAMAPRASNVRPASLHPLQVDVFAAIIETLPERGQAQ